MPLADRVVTARALATTHGVVLCAALAAFVAGPRWHPAAAQSPHGALTVMTAASITRPVRAALDSFAKRTGATYTLQPGASLEIARRVTELRQIPDVILLADPEVFPQLLMPRDVRWYTVFARNRIVLAYTAQSRGADRIDGNNWRTIVTRPGVEVGRADPNTDPSGYRTLFAMQLAERHYRERGLYARLLAAAPERNVRPREADQVALLQTHELDYIWTYQNLAENDGLKFVKLPDDVDLGEPADSALYSLASARILGKRPGDTVTVRGAPILFALTIPTHAEHETLAERFVAYLLSPEGQRVLRAQHLDALDHSTTVESGAPAATAVSVPRTGPIAAPTLRAREDNGAVMLELGPIVLAAHAGHHDVEQPPPLTVALDADGWLHGYEVEIVDADGHPIPHQVLHHVNVIMPTKRELFSDIMLRVAAAGGETGPVSFPSIVGFRVHPGDSLLVSAMLHNPTDRAYVATLRIRMPYKSAKSLIGAVDIYPFYLDVMPPAGSHSFDVPPGHSEHFWEGRPAVDGRILGVGGHVHDYGTLLRLEDRTAHRVLWEGRPQTDSAGKVVGFPIDHFVARLGIPVHHDHVYRLTAIYDNPTGATIVDDGMGALGGVFVPARGTTWPAIDRRSADYRTDYRLTYRVDGMQMAGMAMPQRGTP